MSANSKPKTIALILAVVVIAGIFFYMQRSGTPAGDDPGLRDPRVGQVAPDFSLRTLGDARDVTLAEHRGRVVLIDFWATYCGPCRRSMPHLQQVHTRTSAEDFTLLSINVDGASEDRNDLVNNFTSQFNLTHPILMDTGHASWLYQANRIPLVILVDRDGNIARIYRGTTDPRWIDQAIADLIAKPATTTTAQR